jgi:hypothetical protein
VIPLGDVVLHAGLLTLLMLAGLAVGYGIMDWLINEGLVHEPDDLGPWRDDDRG